MKSLELKFMTSVSRCFGDNGILLIRFFGEYGVAMHAFLNPEAVKTKTSPINIASFKFAIERLEELIRTGGMGSMPMNINFQEILKNMIRTIRINIEYLANAGFYSFLEFLHKENIVDELCRSLKLIKRYSVYDTVFSSGLIPECNFVLQNISNIPLDEEIDQEFNIIKKQLDKYIVGLREIDDGLLIKELKKYLSEKAKGKQTSYFSQSPFIHPGHEAIPFDQIRNYLLTVAKKLSEVKQDQAALNAYRLNDLCKEERHDYAKKHEITYSDVNYSANTYKDPVVKYLIDELKHHGCIKRMN